MFRFNRTSSIYVAIVVIILGGAALVRAADPFFVQALRFIAFDTYQQLGPAPYDPNTPVKIVDINEESLTKIGQWPWPRTTIADLLTKLVQQGAAVVAFDVVFPEEDRTSPDQAVKQLTPAEAAVLAPALAGLPNHDQVFANVIGQTPTVLGMALSQRTDPPVVKAGFAIAGDDPKQFVYSYPGATNDLKILSDAAPGIGAINWQPDRDQVIRRVQLVFRVGGQYVPSLVSEILRVLQNAGSYILKSSNASGESALGANSGLNHIKIGALEIPTDNDGSIWLQFRHARTDTYIPAWKVLNGTDDANAISGNIVIVGTSATGLLDLRATPVDAVVPGFEVHAQAIEHILNQRSLVRLDYSTALEIAIMVALGIGLAVLLPRLNAILSAIVGIVVVVLLPIAGWIAYSQLHLLLDPSFAALVLFILVTTATVYVYRRTEQQRGEVRRAFGYYVAPAVVNEIIAHPQKLELGGEVRELTLLFCDVRNFTSISERMTAHELTTFINNLLTPLSEIILDNRGTIDKYMGDAIMAFWNAPLDDADHAGNALKSGLAMIRRMEALNVEWQKQAEAAGRQHARVAIGIGINSGDCCVGNLGSSQRFDYSAIGDDVNVASRFEGLSKVYGVPIVVGEPTVKRVAGLKTIELDMMRVKGRAEATRIYTAADALGIDERHLGGLTTVHDAMLAAYRGQKWEEAEAAIAQCEAFDVHGLSVLYRVYRGRIAEWRQTPPPADWDGTFTATSK